MRYAVIYAELDHLRVDHNKADLIGTRLVEQAENERIHAHGLTGTGSTGDKHMRQLRNVADDALAADVLAEREAEL